MDYGFKFSVIMPIYNTEEYLEEAIESIVNQDIGFLENVKLILIDDGSKDNSYEICQRYKDKFPNNIVALSKENGGQGSARNLGLEHVDSEYITFLDSDDKLSLNALSVVYDFFHHRKWMVGICMFWVFVIIFIHVMKNASRVYQVRYPGVVIQRAAAH